MGSFHAISRDTNTQITMVKWTNAGGQTMRANERSFVYRPPAWRQWRNVKTTYTWTASWHSCEFTGSWILEASAKSIEIRIEIDRNSFTHTHYKQIWAPKWRGDKDSFVPIREHDVTFEPLGSPLRHRVPWLLYAGTPETGQHVHVVRVTWSWTWSSSFKLCNFAIYRHSWYISDSFC